MDVIFVFLHHKLGNRGATHPYTPLNNYTFALFKCVVTVTFVTHKRR
jgi:hypothetical protein